jgi:hypothetical protein
MDFIPICATPKFEPIRVTVISPPIIGDCSILFITGSKVLIALHIDDVIPSTVKSAVAYP